MYFYRILMNLQEIMTKKWWKKTFSDYCRPLIIFLTSLDLWYTLTSTWMLALEQTLLRWLNINVLWRMNVIMSDSELIPNSVFCVGDVCLNMNKRFTCVVGTYECFWCLRASVWVCAINLSDIETTMKSSCCEPFTMRILKCQRMGVWISCFVHWMTNVSSEQEHFILCLWLGLLLEYSQFS